MHALQLFVSLTLLGAPTPPASRAAATTPPAEAKPESGGPVILFLVDNSGSLPPLDPGEKRVVALEKVFTFLKGHEFRLVLFGGRHELSVDDVAKYNNRGQWTDFYFAFDKARELIKTYPPRTEFRIILLTDGILDPNPGDWEDMGVARGEDLKAHVVARILDLIREIRVPLYVILVGDPPKEGIAPGSREQAPGLILDMVHAANGARAAPMAQSLSSFFDDDGFLLKKFVFRVAPHEGLKKVEPVIRRIVAPPRAGVEVQFLGLSILPLFLFLFLLLGILVRSFPGPGDIETVEMSQGQPVHLAADRLHKLESGGWAPTGLSLVADAKEAAATLTYQVPQLDLTGMGLDTSGLDPLALKLLPMGLDELKKALESHSDSGTKEEKIYALNLDYMAKNFDSKEAERILSSPAAERRRLPALDFLRSKVHLLSNSELRRGLTEPRVQLVGYGRGAERRDLAPGTPVRIGPYGFIVMDIARGGRKDVRLVLYYDKVPSLLGLKTILPNAFQRVFRFRRSSQRIVS